MKMSQNMKFLIIASLLLASTAMGGVTIGKWIFNGNTASLPAGFTMKSDFISTTSGGTPPGMVPLGGMVAVMPQTHSNAWQTPASGVIKDGFMLANGHTVTAQNVTDGCVFSVGTVLPNMVQKYPKGSTTSGTAGGANTRSIAADQLPTFTTDTHVHSWGGFWSIDNATDVNNGNGDGAQNTYSDGAAGIYAWGAGTYASRETGGHSHNQTGGVSGTGGGTLVTPRATNNASGDEQGYVVNYTKSATATYYLPSHRHYMKVRATTSSAVTRTNSSQVALSTEPAYTEVVWVIRVK